MGGGGGVAYFSVKHHIVLNHIVVTGWPGSTLNTPPYFYPSLSVVCSRLIMSEIQGEGVLSLCRTSHCAQLMGYKRAAVPSRNICRLVSADWLVSVYMPSPR